MPPFQQQLDAFLAQFPGFLLDLLLGIVILFASLVISAWLARAAETAARQRRAAKAAQQTLHRLVRWTTLILGALLAIEQVVPNVTSLLAGLGIAGLTIGFALQDVAKNFVAGVLILLQQPFEIGDTIEVSGYAGTVLDISLRTTEMRTLDGRYVILPNGDVLVSPIVNYSRAPSRRLEVKLGVTYQALPERVAQVALEAIQQVPGLLQEPGPEVVFEALGDSAMEVKVYYWADMKQVTFMAAQDHGVRSLKEAFEAARIDLPFPTQTVLLEDQRT